MQFLVTATQQQLVDSIIRRYKNERNLSLSGRNFTNGIDKTLFVLLNNVFKEYLISEKIYQAMVLVSDSPWSIHTDYIKGDDNPANAILIPWKTENTSTIVFNEICYSNDDIDKMENSLSPITEEFYEKHLTHCPQEHVRKVSLHEVFNWERGKGVIWDRKFLHCSDNFIKNGITEKIALVMFTEKL